MWKWSASGIDCKCVESDGTETGGSAIVIYLPFFTCNPPYFPSTPFSIPALFISQLDDQ